MNIDSRWTLLASIKETPRVSIERSQTVSVWRTGEIYDAIKGGCTFLAEGDCREILIDYLRDIKCIEKVMERPVFGVVVINTSKTTEDACILMSKLLDNCQRLRVIQGFPCILINSDTWNTEEILISSLVAILESGILNSITDWSRNSVINSLVRTFYENTKEDKDENLAFSSIFLAMRLGGGYMQDSTSSGPYSYITNNISAYWLFKLKSLLRKSLYEPEICDLKYNLGEFLPWRELL